MTIIRSYTNNFEVVERTRDLLIVPNTWGLTNRLGLFNAEGVSENTITIEEVTESGGLLLDRVRGQRANVSKDYTRKLHSFPIPHFNEDDYITPADIQGKRAFGQDIAETLAAVRARKLERIRRIHAWTQEAARMQCITAGTVYAPNGTVSVNWYTSFSITRKEIDFALGTSATEVIEKIEEAIAHIQDNMLSGDMASEFIAICSPTFFSKLIKHPKIVTAYQYYSSVQEPLRNRQNSSLGANFREFDFGGIRFIEYRGVFGSTALVPDGDAYILPLGVSDLFQTYYGPAERFSTVNTMGQEAYVFERADQSDSKIELQSETNFIHMLRRPQAVVRAYTA